jgi:2-C-methyl-D-erythritol 4-phosphate cytidylyltransferase
VPRRMTVGVVPLEGRGSLPFAELHREALFLHAVRALLDVDRLGDRVIVTVDPEQVDEATALLERAELDVPVQEAAGWWARLTGSVTVVLHDPLCPLVPSWFLSACVDEASATSATGRPDEAAALLAFRPVTDTIKTVIDSRIVDTLDRDRFGIVASPVVFDLDDAGDRPASTEDFAALATWLRERGPVRLRKAPSLGRRVDDPSAVNLLECMDEMAHAVRES